MITLSPIRLFTVALILTTGMVACTTAGRQEPPGKEPGKQPTGKEEPVSPGKTDPGKQDPDHPPIEETFKEDQPEYPEPGDDDFFTAANKVDATFRVLITEGNYQVRQLQNKETLKRKRDVNGDRDQVKVFRRFSDRYNFHNLDFNAVLLIRLNPHSGEIELAKFLPGHTPRAWQVTTFIKDDVSRMAFAFPKQRVDVREFRVQYQWRIRRPAGMTDEQARQRAIEFLKQERDD